MSINDTQYKSDICIVIIKELVNLLEKNGFSIKLDLSELKKLNPKIQFLRLPEYYRNSAVIERTCEELKTENPKLSSIFALYKLVVNVLKEHFDPDAINVVLDSLTRPPPKLFFPFNYLFSGTIYSLTLLQWIFSSIVMSIGYIGLYPFVSKAKRESILGRFFAYTNRCALKVAPLWKLVPLRSAETLPSDRPYIFMINHISMCDWMFVPTAIYPFEAKYLSISTLFNVPFMGVCMRTGGHIPVYFTKKNANGTDGIVKGTGALTVKKTKEALENGHSIAVYPEGGISRNNGVLQPFKDGLFKLSIELGIDIVPVVISGAQLCLVPDSACFSPGTVYSYVCEPISPAGLTLETLKEAVRSSMVSQLKKLPTTMSKL